MNRIELKSKVDRHGMVHVDVPVGLEAAEREVRVTVEPLMPATILSQGEWAAWVQAMAGTWEGDFERPPQPPPEERETL